MPSAAKRKTTGRSWPRRCIDFARPVLAARPGRPPRFPGWLPCFPPLRRAGVHARRTLAISKIGTLRHRRVRRDEGIPPYGRPGWSKTQNLFVGAGFIPPAGPCSAANRADMESAPTKVCYNAGAAVSRSARRHPRFVGEGHGPPADLAAAQDSRDDLRPKSRALRSLASETRLRAQCKHRPLQGFVVTRGRSFPVGRRIAAVRRGPRPKNKIPQASRRAVFQSRPPGRAPHLNSEL